MYKSIQKGFTLIELLVVIAIIGILAAVVLVAINPAERIAEANDSKVKSNIGQVATALESCYTSNEGKYVAACQSAQEVASPNGEVNDLLDGGYLKRAMPASGSDGGVTVVSVSSGAELLAYGQLDAQSNKSKCTGTGTNTYMVYRTSTGNTTIECANSAPTS